MQKNLYEIAYTRILNKVTSGALPPGTRLVNRTLASEIGVSPIPVREALQRLASEGLVEHLPGAGTFVRRFDRRALAKLFRYREVIECFAAREAAGAIDERQLRRLEAIRDDGRALADELRASPADRDAAGDFERLLRNDLAFHRILIEATDNPWLVKSVHDVRLLARVAGSRARRVVTVARAQRVHDRHAALVGALRDRDPDAAERRMREQLGESLDEALDDLERADGAMEGPVDV